MQVEIELLEEFAAEIKGLVRLVYPKVPQYLIDQISVVEFEAATKSHDNNEIFII